MVKKLRKLAAQNSEDATLLDSVCQSAHQIWQAGLGAFAMAQGQGEALFGKLVERGADVQKHMESSTGHTLQAPAVGSTAGSWEKLEKVFEERVGRALHSLGVPSQKDIHALGRQIDVLTEAVARLSENPAAPSKAKAKRVAPATRTKALAAKPEVTPGPRARAATRKKPALSRTA